LLPPLPPLLPLPPLPPLLQAFCHCAHPLLNYKIYWVLFI
jgi:hypothetical protein